VTRAQTAFAVARPEIADLLRTAKSLSDQIATGGRMSPQENQLRHVVVALVAVLQAFVSELLEEKADELGDSWGDLSELQKRYVSVHVRRRIEAVLEEVGEGGLAEPSKVASLRKTTLECAEWYSKPSLLARSARRTKLDGFLQDNGANTLDRTISRYYTGGMSFFNWLAKHYPKYRGIEDPLNILIATRNDVAHGTFERRLTIRDTRLYRVLVYRLITKIGFYTGAIEAMPESPEVLTEKPGSEPQAPPTADLLDESREVSSPSEAATGNPVTNGP
jgi:hypothetical protein